MCGSDNKLCATCYCGDEWCLAAVREDYWMPATKQQLIERLDNNRYKENRKEMIDFLFEKYGELYNKH